MKLWRWLVILTPTLLGIALMVFFFQIFDQNHTQIVYLRSDLGTLSFLIGLLLSMVVALVFWLLNQIERVRVQAISNAAEERRRFLRRLDHELKNPLTAIRAGLANLAEPSPSFDYHDALASLDTQTLRMSRLSSDLRKFAEIEERQLERLPVDISVLLREAFQMALEQPSAAERTLTLSLPQAPWPLPTIMGDADLLLVAVHNLLDNSIKFSSPGDTVELRAFEDGQRIVIEVADTGPGIPDDEQMLVWEELYRGNSSSGVPGSGLGLALVRAIVDRHDGSVGLRSRLEQGTVFTIRLPSN